MKRVLFHFDFVSPYSWLALSQAEAFGRRHDVEWVVRPVVYAALLDAAERVGPAEVEAQRVYTFRDVDRCARRLGLRFEGPPAHPFRSIEALRVSCLFQNEAGALGLAARIADTCWSAGLPLTDFAVLQGVVTDAGFDAADLPERVARPEVKALLRANTEEAIDGGVFGVPSFRYGDEIFWGHDRLSFLGEALRRRGPAEVAAVRRMLARPRQAERKR